MKRALWLGGGIAFAAGLALAGILLPDPDPQPPGPIGRELDAAGPAGVRTLELVLTDPDRATPASGAEPARSLRTLHTSVWLPEPAGASRLPLVLYAHGFMGSRRENARLCRHLASRGFAVAAPDFPRTSSEAPGDPDLADLPEQPGDLRFLIDALLEAGRESPLHQRVDPQRIGVVGLSLGGMTAQLVGFHPRLRDPRVAAVVSIAGPVSMFSRAYFEGAPLPFLMIAGDVDAIVDYRSNGLAVLERAPGARLWTLAGGSHVGATDLGARLLRWMENPDSLACASLEGSMPSELPPLGGSRAGILSEPDGPLPCQTSPLPQAMRPPRQRMLTRIAVTAFLEARLRDRGDDLPKLRALALENDEVSLDVAP